MIPTRLIVTTALYLAATLSAAADDRRRVNCRSAMSTYEMNICAQRDFDAADAKLNTSYKAALSAVSDMAGDKPYDVKSWQAALRASQRAWIAFRDAECNGHVAMFWTGGTGATVDILGCMTEKTKQRTVELDNRYSDR